MSQPRAESRELKAQSQQWDSKGAEELAMLCGAPQLALYDAVESTLDVAHALAEQDAPAGTVVLADSQRAGRGRMGRAWSSEPGRGVWCTLIERTIDATALDVLSIRVGLEIADRLDAHAGERVGLKWPNDLVLALGKLGGILVETRWSGSTLAWVAIGVGVNVKRPLDQPSAIGLRNHGPAESREPRAESRLPVLTAIVAGARAAAARTGHLTADELTRFAVRDALKGRRIVEPLAGVVSGIAANGALVVETRRGAERLRTGTIRLAEGT